MASGSGGRTRDSAQGWQDNPAWDEALRRQPDIAFSGRESPTERPSTVVLHRPEELVVDAAQYDDREDRNGIRGVLDRVNADDRGDDAAARLGLRRLFVPDEVDLVRLVRRLRERAPGVAALNSVLVANPQRYGGCAPPTAAAPPEDVPGNTTAGKGKTIAVLDTGIAGRFPSRQVASPSDAEVLEELPQGQPGPAVGHGTFVAGVVARHAPGATIVVRRVLQTALGVADELEIAEALREFESEREPVDVLNLSFGGFAVDDATMLAFERAVNALPRTTLVVAAAGNHGVERPHFSAAFKRVVAVGSAEGRERADYSNFGGWVDCCAAGTDVHSTFIHFPGAFEGGAISSGTSFAAPQVAAAAAVLAERDDIPVRLAAHRLIHDPSRPEVAGVGTLVDPNALPPSLP